MNLGIPLHEARRRVEAHLHACPVVHEPPERCDGLYTAEPVYAPTNLPHDTIARRDGYAVRSADIAVATRDNPVHLPIGATVTAGSAGSTPPPELVRGQAVGVMTGALIPGGADTVLGAEEVERSADGNTLVIFEPAPAGRRIAQPGDEIAAGECVVAARRPVGPETLALMTALGLTGLPVHRRPKVAVLPIGDELVSPGTALESGQRYPDGAILLAAAMRGLKLETYLLSPAPDDLETLRQRLRGAVDDGADLLITTGGTGGGSKDLVRELLARPEAEVVFSGVAVRPGGSTAFGFCGPVPWFALPGTPAAAVTAFDLLVRPAARALLGAGDTRNPEATVTLLNPEQEPSPGRLQRLRVEVRAGRLYARRVRYRNIYRELAESNALWVPGAAGKTGGPDSLSGTGGPGGADSPGEPAQRIRAELIDAPEINAES